MVAERDNKSSIKVPVFLMHDVQIYKNRNEFKRTTSIKFENFLIKYNSNEKSVIKVFN